jgi:hypothetical protein
MQLSQPSPSDTPHCPICRARLERKLPFCPICGAQLDDTRARQEEELRGVLYLLSELERWVSDGEMDDERASRLRSTYESRRENLRRSLREGYEQNLNKSAAPRPPTEGSQAEPARETHAPPKTENRPVAFPIPPSTSPTAPPAAPHAFPRPERTLLERLADPRTLRLLLYTGAGMLVVGVVIWLRDLLYLKLQEPAVQAGLLALGTAGLMASGWYTILRTRQRWTGRALTVAGSLLVPVNFWFLVRSGLIENHGRAWVVCVFCTLLYAYTAALLRERLYVYLSSAAMVATFWTIILRDEPRAFGLYALSLMAASLVLLHLSRIFPPTADDSYEAEDEAETQPGRPRVGRWSRELWSAPLVRTALCYVALSLLLYLPLRFVGYAPSFYSGIFRLRSSSYDASIALLILAGAAYALWFAGRYVYAKWSEPFYTASVLLFFLTLLTTCDGFRLQEERQLLILALAAFITSLFARNAQSDSLSLPFYNSSLVVTVILAFASMGVLLNAQALSVTHSAAMALVAASFAALSAPRFSSGLLQTVSAYMAALYFSLGYFVAIASTGIRSETLLTALCAAWPLLLYIAAEMTARLKRETQLATPFTRAADAFALLMLLWGGLLVLLLHLSGGGISRPSSIVALASVIIFCGLRAARERSVYAALLGTLACVIITADLLDGAQKSGLWPASWPIAAGTIVFTFIFERAAMRLLRSRDEAQRLAWQPLTAAIHVVLDSVVCVGSLLWLVTAFERIGAGGFGAPSVLLLALMYWVERAAETRASWSIRVTAAHMGAFLATLLIALGVDAEWLNLLFVLIIFPTFFALGRYERARAWLYAPLSEAAVLSLALSLLLALIQSGTHLEAGDEHLLAPALTVAAIALLSFTASIFSRGRASVLYFRAGLWTAVVSLMLASLRAGFDPIEDAEVYSTPIALLLLVIAYLSHRRAWSEYEPDVGVLLWTGSLLLCAPLLVRSLEFRLVLDRPAPWRDVGVLIASLALIFYGVLGRMRAPVLAGFVTLVTELSVIALTSVNWLQVPLKYYLITVGALLLIIFGTLEYRREQFLLLRKRFQDRRDRAREQFGEWR